MNPWGHIHYIYYEVISVRPKKKNKKNTGIDTTLVTWRVTPNTEQSKPVQTLCKIRLKAGGVVALSAMYD